MSRTPWAQREWLLDPIKDAKAAGLKHNVCRYCGGRVEKPRISWCSSECAHTWVMFRCWDSMRRFVWCRAGKKCEVCGIDVVLRKHEVNSDNALAEIHHKVQVVSGGSDEPYNLICLCYDCHKKQHYALEDI